MSAEHMLSERHPQLSKETLEAILKIARIEVSAVYELANEYWPRTPGYAQVRADNPWWLVITRMGPLKIGPRKRVIHIDYSALLFRGKVTEDDVTSTETYVHAYSYLKAAEYLTTLEQKWRGAQA